jgi:hypothetical protein
MVQVITVAVVDLVVVERPTETLLADQVLWVKVTQVDTDITQTITKVAEVEVRGLRVETPTLAGQVAVSILAGLVVTV